MIGRVPGPRFFLCKSSNKLKTVSSIDSIRAPTNLLMKDSNMSVKSIATKFIDLCNQGKHFEVMRTMYAPEMVSVEGNGKEFVGKENVIRKSEVFQGNNDILSQDLRGPYFLGDADTNSGRFAVWTSIDFSPKAGGKRESHTEVGLYTVKNDTITREEFFYDGAFI
jgi:hypothetical protein